MKKKYITASCFLGIVLVSTSIFYVYHRHHTTFNPNNQPQPVELKKIQGTILPHVITTTGSLYAYQSTNISAKVSGYITQIYYKEGDYVTAGTPLIQLDNRAEQAALLSARASAALSELQEKRDKKLLARGFITQDVYYSLKVANQQNQANVLTDLTQLDEKTVKAPFSGIIGKRGNSIGDYINAGNTITTLVDSHKLRVEYALPSGYQYQIKLGQKVIVTTPTLSQQKFIGEVTYIAALIDPDTQTISVHATLTNNNDALKPGQFVAITQVLGPGQNTILVPTTSVFASIQGYYVYSVKNNKAVQVPIKVGNKFKNTIEVTAGLKPGDMIVVAGQEHLTNNQAVHVVK